MTSEDTVVEVPLMSVRVYLKSKFFLFRVTVHLLHFYFGDEIVSITDR